MKKAIVFRLLALSQVSYEAGCFARDALRRRLGAAPKKSVNITAPDGTSFGELRVSQGMTLSDLVPSCRELLRNSVLNGHVNPDLFCGVSVDNYPELLDKDAVADNRRLLRVAMDHVWRIATMGAGRSGCLIPYVASQHEHFSECQSCIDTVLGRIREDLRTRSAMDRLFERAGMLRAPEAIRH